MAAPTSAAGEQRRATQETGNGTRALGGLPKPQRDSLSPVLLSRGVPFGTPPALRHPLDPRSERRELLLTHLERRSLWRTHGEDAPSRRQGGPEKTTRPGSAGTSAMGSAPATAVSSPDQPGLAGVPLRGPSPATPGSSAAAQGEWSPLWGTAPPHRGAVCSQPSTI